MKNKISPACDCVIKTIKLKSIQNRKENKFDFYMKKP